MPRSHVLPRRSALLLPALSALLAFGCAPAAAGAMSESSRAQPASQASPPSQARSTALVVHGGAGTIRRDQMTPERDREYRLALARALYAGQDVLDAGGTSMDAVIAAIRIMEDSPLFNAGRGAVFTNDGRNELDASLMDGRTLAAGAVAGVTRVRNPIELARAVMERSPHVMMAGAGADRFAEEQGLELVDPAYFRTEARWEALQRARESDRIRLSEEEDPGAQSGREPDDFKFGTVGAVALDREGDLAAGTSTGGMTNKRWGRIGDAPIIGAGTYANNHSCGVSATGHGEYFIRAVVAYDICARMEYRGISLENAGREVVMERLVEMGGEGGVVALDRDGNVSMPFNTPGMYRGYIDSRGRALIMIYSDDPGIAVERAEARGP